MYTWEKLDSFNMEKGEFNTFLQHNLKLSVRAYVRDNETLVRVTERGIIDSKKEETTFAGQSAKNASSVASLNVENDEGDSLIDSIKDCNILPDQQIIIKDNRNMIVKALMSLSKSERKAFWLTIHEELSLRDAGVKMNMSHERVNQLKKKAMTKIAKMQLV
jgi:RNA polymerase sigma factor (sigma-70 family)